MASAWAARPASLGGGAWQQQRALLAAQVPSLAFDGLAVEAIFPGLGRRRAVLYGRRLLHRGQPTGQLVLGVRELLEVE